MGAVDRQFLRFLSTLLYKSKFLSKFASKMIRKRSFIWFLTALCAVCLAMVTHWQGQDVVPEQNLPERTESSVVTQQHNQPHEAILTDATQLYRICSSRPQRILPLQGSRSVRTLQSAFYVGRQHFVKLLHSYFDSRCRMESAPFCLSSSCDYYVIALRHIIR